MRIEVPLEAEERRKKKAISVHTQSKDVSMAFTHTYSIIIRMLITFNQRN